MDSILKNSKFFFAFSLCLFSTPCFPFPISSNFVLISSHSQPTFVEYKSPKHNFEVELQQHLHKYDSRCESVFSFYASSNSLTPKMVTKKDNKVFIFANNKLEPLGFFISPENKELSRMENSVAEGKLLVGFKNKENEPVAIVKDNNGVVYSVRRLSKQQYSIQSLGILANNS